MATILADTLLQSARVARDLLTPRVVVAPTAAPTAIATPAAPLTLELQARIQAARDETLEYHRTHRPPNTARSYAPKQKEWRTWCAA
jgi:hypothetical protein